ncbi:hypothetical protein KEM60_00484 [Austwickia sp. TVS 96-490-7B]|nr:hypothetical protein [Austwickia sp. TVS 96-490-7B]
MLKVVQDAVASNEVAGGSLLDEIVRDGARQMLTTQWQDEAAAFNKRPLKGTDYVYCWVDGIHLKVRLEQDKVCLLVIIGVRADGTKELVALDDGHRESTESWADLLRDCNATGCAPPCWPWEMARLGSGQSGARGVP